MQRHYRRTHLLRHPRWRALRSLHPAPATAVRRLLCTADSLTQLCQRACKGRFQVLPLDQVWGRPHLSEARLLGIHPQHLAFIRQVLLRCDDKAWIFARTVVPLATLRGKHKRLLHLGSRSLGAFLFSFKNLTRTSHESSRFSRAELAAFAGNPRAAPPGAFPVWGRRQVYRADGRDLLISEIFLQPKRLR